MKTELRNNLKTFAPYIIGGVGLYLVYKFFFKKSDQENTSEDVVNAQDKKIIELSKIYKPTYSIDYYGTLANIIYSSIAQLGGDNYVQTFNSMLKILNPLDLAYTIKAYGIRQRYVFGIPEGYPEDMLTSVSKELRSELIRNPFTSSKVDLINKWFAEHNITERL